LNGVRKNQITIKYLAIGNVLQNILDIITHKKIKDNNASIWTSVVTCHPRAQPRPSKTSSQARTRTTITRADKHQVTNTLSAFRFHCSPFPVPAFFARRAPLFHLAPLCHADLCRKIEAHSHSPGALHQRHHHTTPPVQQQEDRTKASGDKATKDAAAAVLPPCLQPASHRPSARIVREPRLFPPSCRPSRFLSARPPAPGPSKHAVALQQRSRGGARDAVT
jgi:hypothetical protein